MNQIEKQVLRVIGDNPDSPDVFTDTQEGIAQIRDSVNDAIQELNQVTGGYTQTFSIPLAANKTYYRLRFQNGYFGWVQDAWLVNQGRRLTQTSLHRLNQEYRRWMESTGSPEQYFTIGHDVFGIYRKPSSSSDIIEITACVIPGSYTNDTERLKLREDYKWAVVNYAVSEYWASRGSAPDASMSFAHYLKDLGMYDQYSLFADRKFTKKTQEV